MWSALWKWVLRYLYFWKTAEQVALVDTAQTSSPFESQTGVSTQSPVKTSSSSTLLSIQSAAQQHATTSFASTSFSTQSAAQQHEKNSFGPTLLSTTIAAQQSEKSSSASTSLWTSVAKQQHEKNSSKGSFFDAILWFSETVANDMSHFAKENLGKREIWSAIGFILWELFTEREGNTDEKMQNIFCLLLQHLVIILSPEHPVLAFGLLAIWYILKKIGIFTYFQTRKSPLIISLSPQTSSLCGSDVLLCGENFPKNPHVNFGEKEATVHWSNANHISVKTPSSDRKGPVPVKLDGQKSTHQYTYEDTKLSVSKVELCIDRAFLKEVVIIHGTGFLEGTLVKLDGNSATGIDVVSDRKLRVRAPITPGPGIIDLELSIPGETYSVMTRFKYPRSTIVSITPSSGALSGGDWIDVCGKDFIRGQVVMFGNECALETEFISANKLRARVPAALQPGPVPIRLMGQAVSHCQYTYFDRLAFFAI